MNVSTGGLNFLKRLEGEVFKVYTDAAGFLTAGVGHLLIAQDNLRAGQQISKSQSDAFLRADVRQAETAVNQAVKVPLSQNEFDALCSFTFNVGIGAFNKSTLLKKLNAGDRTGAANEFARWNKAGGKVQNGLVKRRAAEKALFESGAAGGGGAQSGAAQIVPLILISGVLLFF